VKAIKPDIEVIGVEAELYPSMKQTLAGEPVSCAGATIAEGIAVKSPGHITREIIRELVDDIVLVSEECLECAIDTLITEQKLVVEGAGAAGFAAILADPQRFHGRKVGTVLCGGNIDARILASILMRGLVRQRRMVRLRIALTDAPGALAKVAQFLGDAGGNIVEIYHRRLFHNVPVKMADIDVVIETRDHGHVDAILAKLHEAGYPAELMDDVS
jgi:threonine dehydratase